MNHSTANQPQCPHCRTTGWHSTIDSDACFAPCGTVWSGTHTTVAVACMIIKGLRDELTVLQVRSAA